MAEPMTDLEHNIEVASQDPSGDPIVLASLLEILASRHG